MIWKLFNNVNIASPIVKITKHVSHQGPRVWQEAFVSSLQIVLILTSLPADILPLARAQHAAPRLLAAQTLDFWNQEYWGKTRHKNTRPPPHTCVSCERSDCAVNTITVISTAVFITQLQNEYIIARLSEQGQNFFIQFTSNPINSYHWHCSAWSLLISCGQRIGGIFGQLGKGWALLW